MAEEKRYPIGIQTFEKIREDNFLYVDKTEYIYRLAHTGGTYYFLSRPRRFGKSLLLSTMKSYFEGKKELFKGLAIERLEKDWTEYPVLHFSMASGKHMEKEQLELYLNYQLENQEKLFGITEHREGTNNRLADLIFDVYKQTGRKVVVLIDEYDAPLLDVVHENTQLPVLRNVMRNFYSPLKDCDPYLRFVFLTGITKFSQLSIFSELNNIANISMLPEYAAICGITTEEITEQIMPGVDALAQRLGTDRQHALKALRDNYDGYHFTWPSPDVFNPFSLINALNNRNLKAYWFSSGTPTYLIEMMRRFNVIPSEIGNLYAPESAFDAPTENMKSLTPLLYQSGYVTIKDYDEDTQLYTLDIPNREIRVGLYESLLPQYLDRTTDQGNVTIALMSKKIREDDIDGALQLLQTFLGTVPHCNVKNREGHYQQMLYVIFSLLTNFLVAVEVHTPLGRLDMALMTRTRIYIIELKLNRDAQTALRQITLKNYASQFALSGLPVTKVGVSFDTETRNISDWTIA